MCVCGGGGGVGVNRTRAVLVRGLSPGANRPRRLVPADGTAGPRRGRPDPAHGRTRKSLVHDDLVLLLWEPLEAGVAVHGGEAGVCRPAALPFWLYHLYKGPSKYLVCSSGTQWWLGAQNRKVRSRVMLLAVGAMC